MKFMSNFCSFSLKSVWFISFKVFLFMESKAFLIFISKFFINPNFDLLYQVIILEILQSLNLNFWGPILTDIILFIVDNTNFSNVMCHPGKMFITLISVPPLILSLFLKRIDSLIRWMNSSEFSSNLLISPEVFWS